MSACLMEAAGLEADCGACVLRTPCPVRYAAVRAALVDDRDFWLSRGHTLAPASFSLRADARGLPRVRVAAWTRSDFATDAAG